jgi:hypothetical protein
MNKELIEKASAIREDLLALSAHATDVKTLTEFLQKPRSTMWRDYEKLWPYMTEDQKSRSYCLGGLQTNAENYLAAVQYGRAEDADVLRLCKDLLTGTVTKMVPLMIADLDDLLENLNEGNSGTAKIGSGSNAKED